MHSFGYIPGVRLSSANISEPTEGSEMSAELKRTLGIYPKERIQYLKPDESLKSKRNSDMLEKFSILKIIQ